VGQVGAIAILSLDAAVEYSEFFWRPGNWQQTAEEGEPDMSSVSLSRLAILAILVALAPGGLRGQEAVPTLQPAARVAELIQQLGAEDFAARESAQAELAQLGLEAFDALHAAQNDNDPEISLRARHLVRSMSVRWFHESDAPEVVKILRGYGDQVEGERRNRMESLAKLPEQLGVPALCRLARFETVDPLAKYAALQVLQQPVLSDPPQRERLAKTITSIVGTSKRAATSWLLLYAQSLSDPAGSLAAWDSATRAEQASMDKNPEKTSPEIVRDLYRWQVDLLERQGKEQDAIEVIRRTFTLVNGTPDQVKELVGWLIHEQKHALVAEVAGRFTDTFNNSPELLYRLAETQLKLGDAAAAQATADRALSAAADNLDEHLRVASLLQESYGLHEWAEREYRHVMKQATPGSVPDFKSRFYLSELLHDQGKEQAAAETLQPVCELMDKDQAAKETCLRALRDPGGVVSRMHYFYACALIEQEKFADAEARLDKAVGHDENDADALIALFRLPNVSAERRDKTKALIDSSVALFRKQLDQYKANAEQAPTGELQKLYNDRVALMCNQIAWLVGNTYGDFDEAVRLSQRSLEIRQDYPGYLDTLGRCYFAKGDLENAIKYQSQAVKLDPHSGQIRRQLEFFKKEQAARQKP
jgi:tetratricopeptide (TPR) repeat protein